MSDRLVDPRLAQQLTTQLDAGPHDQPPSDWAADILDRLDQVPMEMRATRDKIASTLSDRDDLSEVHRAWARSQQLLARPATTSANLRDAALALIDHGAALQGYPILARLARRARAENRRVLSELLYLATMAAADAVQQVPDLHLRHANPGEDPQAGIAAEALALATAGRLSDFADLVEGHRDALTEGLPDLEGAATVASAMLRAPSALSPIDLGRRRGIALRGVGFALSPMAEARYHAYYEYAQARHISSAWLGAFGERWAHQLMTRGWLVEADTLLQERLTELAPTSETAWCHSTLLRARARLWRFAGDLDYALALNDEARAVIDADEVGTWASVRAAVAINRSSTQLERGDLADAYASATLAGELYEQDGISIIGVTEADEMRTATNPDRRAAAQLGRDLIARDQRKPLPGPGRATALFRAGEAVAIEDVDLALKTLDLVDSIASTNRRVRVQAALCGSRIALEHAPERALDWGRRAADRANLQENLLLRAQAGMVCAWCEAAANHQDRAIAIANTALDDLASSLLGLTAHGETQVTTTVAQDLSRLFEIAVAAGDGELALRIAEVGRTIRLSALMRLDLDQLPDQVRTALARATGAYRVIDEAPNPQTRAVASAVLPTTLDDYESVVGPILRMVTAEPNIDLRRYRQQFPDTHILTLGEHNNGLRWVWWAPGPGQRPMAGDITLPRRTLALIDRLVGGTAATFPGSLGATLAPLLPQSLRTFADDRRDPIRLLISPAGRLWHVPFLAIELSEKRRLVDAAIVTLSPSVSLAYALSTRERTRAPEDGRATGYFNPDLSGARLEHQTLHRAWHTNYQPLASVSAFGTTMDASLGVASTHAGNEPGLAQSLRDHTGATLTAGQCLMRTFPRVVVLGACHGFDSATGPATREPIGLITVISARGATWVIGGHQRLIDPTVGWILSQTYQGLHDGQPVPVALRSAQRTYLEHLSKYSTTDGAKPESVPQDLHQILTDIGGVHVGLLPWAWALTPVGPPT